MNVMDFSTAPQFESLADGTFYVRVGNQTNCGGIAGVHLRITSVATPGLLLRVADSDGEHYDEFGPAVPGSAVPAGYQNALFDGARSAFEETTHSAGVSFELLDALVHPTDANVTVFKTAGIRAMKSWLDSDVGKTQTPD